MSQHDYILENQSGASFRADLNLVLASIVTNNSGATQPATTYPLMPWADTTSGIYKIRNSANTGWIDVFYLSTGNPTGFFNAVSAGGTANALTGNYTPDVVTLTDGLGLALRAAAANTTTIPTFSPNGLPAKTIVKGNNLPLSVGDVAGAGHWLCLQYDATLDKWVLSNPATGIVSATRQAGEVCYFAMGTVPSGFLRANGAAVSRTTYAALFSVIGTTFGAGDGSTTFNLPDLRGEFVRGWDDGRGVDSDRVLGSAQTDALKSHTHTLSETTGDDNSNPGGSTRLRNNAYVGRVTGATGDSETRPRNVALLACISY